MKSNDIGDIHCHLCNMYIHTNLFFPSELKKNKPRCKNCLNKQIAVWQANNPDKVTAIKDKWYTNNKDRVQKAKEQDPEKEKARRRKNYENNIDHILDYAKDYRQKNKESQKIKRRKYTREKYKTDPVFKIKQGISTVIGRALINGKGGESCWDWLGYTPQEITDHIERLFSHPDNLLSDGSVWMNWNNRGRYIPSTWDDNNPTTWTWQIDHIIPHSLFEYSSMQDESFKKCWSLNNLRPLSAKQNHIDGTQRKRHK